MVSGADPRITVGWSRVKIDRIARDLGRVATDGGQRTHLVVAGPGGGKTHALDAIVAGLRRRRPGALVLRPSVLGVGSYADLLYESIRSHDPALADRGARAASSWVAFENLITDKAATQPVVLVLDDVDRLFSRIERVAHGYLRNWVDQVANVALVASAETTRNPASRSRRPWPWRSMFDVTDLPPLEVDDAVDLVRVEARKAGRDDRIAELAQPWRRREIADLHTRLGGNPRVWTITAAHLARTDGIDTPLPAIFDQLAPYFLPRLQTLSPLSSRLVVALARAGAPVTVSTLAKRVGLSHQNTAAALSRLALTQWVVQQKPPAGADQRSRLYAIAESSMREFIRDRDSRQSTSA